MSTKKILSFSEVVDVNFGDFDPRYSKQIKWENMFTLHLDDDSIQELFARTEIERYSWIFAFSRVIEINQGTAVAVTGTYCQVY